mgnify:CR=1 FL=1
MSDSIQIIPVHTVPSYNVHIGAGCWPGADRC